MEIRIRHIVLLCISLILLMMPLALAQTLDEASRAAAKKYKAKVISATTVTEGKKKTHVIKLLTEDGVVKTVRVPVKKD